MSTRNPAPKKKKAGPAKQSTEEEKVEPLVNVTFSACWPRRLVGGCDLLQWFPEEKSFSKYLLTVDFVPDPVGWI